jgi:hypothetical protein
MKSPLFVNSEALCFILRRELPRLLLTVVLSLTFLFLNSSDRLKYSSGLNTATVRAGEMNGKTETRAEVLHAR